MPKGIVDGVTGEYARPLAVKDAAYILTFRLQWNPIRKVILSTYEKLKKSRGLDIKKHKSKTCVTGKFANHA